MQTVLPNHAERMASGSPARPSHSLQFAPAAARWALLALLLGIYLGGMPYLVVISPVLLYGAYLVMISASAMVLVSDWPSIRGLRWVAPYLAWATFYCYWGTLVAPPELSLGEAAKTWMKVMLVTGTLALALNNRRTLRLFANLVQGAAMVNVAIALWEVKHPALIEKLARAHDSLATAFNVERPAGIWSNPDAASFGYLFALLLSFWGRGPVVWAGRLACFVGIYLSASRTGAYVLLLGCLLLAVGKIGRMKWRPGVIAVIILGAMAAVGIGLAAVKMAPAGAFDLSQNRNVLRFADFLETDATRSGDPGRVEIAQAAAVQAFEGPWYGYGLYTFQMEPKDPLAVLDVGAHNLFITVWGETGIPGAVTFSVLLAIGLCRLATVPLSGNDRLLLTLFWMGYLLIALTWHNQMTSFVGMLYTAALWHLPGVLGEAGMERQ
ncbi:MAG TPA: O-antigen ligase family protein [Chthoniobacteraceae bacterium]|nr:O-antigen ligase family protein [Chthoniobacteraceae bacterium]